MGKRQIGQLQPYELVVAIMISDLASLPMQDTRIPLLHGVIPIVTLFVLQILISLLQLKSEKARNIFDGKPNLIVKDGKIQIGALKSQIFTTSDLMEELRINGYFNINEIEYAILETNGQISVLPKSNFMNTTKQDMNIKSQKNFLPMLLITDGKINKENLKIFNKSEAWLNELLQKNNIENYKDIFLAYMDTNNKFIYQYYDKSIDEEGDINL
jgi:Predicted membrane protein